MIQVSDITQYFYCPRKVYFLKTLGIRPPEKPKMEQGKAEHEREYRRLKERVSTYGFPDCDIEMVMHRVSIESETLRLHGVVDTVIVLRTGEYLPVEVKYSSYFGIQRNRKKQLVAYALLLEERFGTIVRRGILYLSTDRKMQMVDITLEDKSFLKRDIAMIRDLIRSERMPEVKKDGRCNYCEMSKFCV
ncbi:MAG: CRISPR-associated protein Cas4 [Methanomicrobiales archaeon]|nr:CRISPR-associated protein Cas4 [Methanomicrobiales archaeon]MDI6876084.1 CRISPR-associated protein Cas4 [Methanomicrobiales archaeon]